MAGYCSSGVGMPIGSDALEDVADVLLQLIELAVAPAGSSFEGSASFLGCLHY